MRYTHLLRHKWVFYIACIMFLYLIYGGAVINYLNFDVNAPDLPAGQGEMIRQSIFISNFNSSNAIFELISAQSFILPIVIALVSFDYRAIVKGYLKNGVGKEICLKRELSRCKFQISMLIFSIYTGIYLFVILLSLVIGRYQSVDLSRMINPLSLLHDVVINDIMYHLFFLIIGGIAIVVNTYLALSLMDYCDNFIRTVLAYLGFIWLLSVMSYRLLPYYFSPMTSIMTFAYGHITLGALLAPYISFAIIFLWLRRQAYEVK